MNKAQRMRAVLHREKADRIPWALYPSYLIFGSTELEIRNQDLGIYCPLPVHRLYMPDVEVTDVFRADQKRGIKHVARTYSTPRGDLTGTLAFKYKTAYHSMFADATMSQPGLVPDEGIWPTEYFFKQQSDYEILEFVIENSVYQPSYDQYVQTSDFLGGEGIAMALVWKTPFQTLVYDWMGPETCYVECMEHPKEFRRLYEVMCAKQRELFEIIAESPAQEVWIGENLTNGVTSPRLFREFCLSFYNEIADLLHKHGKILGCHFDGQLRGLENLIAETKLDFIDAFTPPPIGDLPIEDARASWPDKVILCNFPGNVFFEDGEEIERYTLELLRKVAPGDNFALVTTENFPLHRWVEGFKVLAKVLSEHGQYPIRL
jgi:hypothetical protein